MNFVQKFGQKISKRSLTTKILGSTFIGFNVFLGVNQLRENEKFKSVFPPLSLVSGMTCYNKLLISNALETNNSEILTEQTKIMFFTNLHFSAAFFNQANYFEDEARNSSIHSSNAKQNGDIEKVNYWAKESAKYDRWAKILKENISFSFYKESQNDSQETSSEPTDETKFNSIKTLNESINDDFKCVLVLESMTLIFNLL